MPLWLASGRRRCRRLAISARPSRDQAVAAAARARGGRHGATRPPPPTHRARRGDGPSAAAPAPPRRRRRRGRASRRPRPWRSDPAKADCGREVPAEPTAGSGPAGSGPRRSTGVPGPARAERTGAGKRGAGPCTRGTQVEHGLIPRPGPTRAGPAVGQVLSLAAGQAAAGHRPGQHPGGVGLHHADRVLEGEGQHGPGRVGADAGQGRQRGQVGGDDTVHGGR